MEGYAARKQTHLHKTAMILSASRDDSLIIEEDDLMLANSMLSDLESDMTKVFSRIGRSEESIQAERFLDYIKKKGKVLYEDAYKNIYLYFPDFRDFEGVVLGCVRSGYIDMKQVGTDWWLFYKGYAG
jgi:hypothetical protein